MALAVGYVLVGRMQGEAKDELYSEESDGVLADQRDEHLVVESVFARQFLAGHE